MPHYTATSRVFSPMGRAPSRRLPITSGLFAWYDADSFSGTTWFDRSGNGRNATVARGTVSRVSTTGNGASRTFNTLQGGTGDGIQFPADVLPSTFTLFHITRYRGITNLRIFDGFSQNWLNGFWSGLSGIAHHNGWLTQTTNSHHYNNWMISSSQTGLYRANMVQRSFSIGGDISDRLTINAGNYTSRVGAAGNETSAWECAEVIVYNRNLSEAEIIQVETYLDRRYGLGLTTSTLPIPQIGLSVYLDASNTSSYPGSGNTWNDLSGNGRNYTWSSASWTSSGNLSYFNTSGRVCTGPASNNFGMAMQSGYTVITVAQINSNTTSGAFKWFTADAVSASRAIFSHLPWVDGNWYYDQAGCCDAQHRMFVSVGGQNGTPRMWTARRSINTGPRTQWRGNNIINTNSTAANNSNLSGTAMMINANDEGYNWDARLYAFIAYSRALTDAEIGSIFTHFSGRGIQN